MRLSDYLDSQAIFLDLPAAGKDDALAQIVDRLADKKLIGDRGEFLALVNAREGQGGTAIGRGMAIPHARCKNLERILLAMTRLRRGVEFGAEDGEPVQLVFLLAAPCNKAGEYLKVLARLSKLLKVNGLRKELLKAGSTAEILNLLEKAENRLS